jgi:mRNA-degrading endonuclease RelE of RelBE toxin-antitoxin system
MKETLENLSKTTYKPEFREKFEDLKPGQKKEIGSAIQELVTDYLTEPWNHPHAKYIPVHGEIWRLKVKDEKTDHRVFFDINDEGLVFLTVEHRDTAYKK